MKRTGDGVGARRSAPDRDVRRFIAGDPLRAVAALWVVLFHVGQTTLWVSGRPNLWGSSFGYWPGIVLAGGGAGVAIFFVLSGYLIARPFVRALQGGLRLPGLGRYAAARILRIYPAFWVVVALVIAIYGTQGATTGALIDLITLRHFDGSNPLAGQLAPVWSLPLEVAFYVVVPIAAGLLALLLRPVTRPSIRRVTLIVVPVLVWVVAAVEITVYRNSSLVFFAAASFAPGVTLAAVEPHIGRRARSAKAARGWLAMAAFSGVALIIEGVYSSYVGQWQLLIPSTLAAGIVSGLLLHQRATGRCPRILDNRVMDWLGERSYGIYIYHFLMLSLCWKWALEPGAWKQTMMRLTLATLVLTIAAADLSWRWVESPALALRSRIKRREPERGSSESPALAGGESEASESAIDPRTSRPPVLS